jgi:hypothetical protein
MERLRIIWLMECFQIPKRRLEDTLGVSRPSVGRWLKALEKGSLGKRYQPKEPVNKTPKEIAQLIWGISQQNPMWGKERIAMTLWGLGVFGAVSTVRTILHRPRPRRSSPEVAAAEGLKAGPRQIVARYRTHLFIGRRDLAFGMVLPSTAVRGHCPAHVSRRQAPPWLSR